MAPHCCFGEEHHPERNQLLQRTTPVTFGTIPQACIARLFNRGAKVMSGYPHASVHLHDTVCLMPQCVPRLVQMHVTFACRVPHAHACTLQHATLSACMPYHPQRIAHTVNMPSICMPNAVSMHATVCSYAHAKGVEAKFSAVCHHHPYLRYVCN